MVWKNIVVIRHQCLKLISHAQNRTGYFRVTILYYTECQIFNLVYGFACQGFSRKLQKKNQYFY